MTILIALGANLPGRNGLSPRETCAAALDRLSASPDLQVEAVSGWYRSRPVPAGDQPDYCNGAALLCGNIAPESLLTRLHAIEAEFGRVRTVVNAARPLDLDLIAMGDLVRTGTPPLLPHPRTHLRRFVLRPLLDIAPDWVHPLHRQSVAAMLAGLPETPEDDVLPWRD